MIKIGLGGGHGIFTSGKRCLKSIDPKETREWWLNARIVSMVENGLKDYEDVSVLRVDDRTGKRDVPLEERVRMINSFKPDIYVSYHHNAGVRGGSGGGITVHRAKGSSAKTKKYQDLMYGYLIKHTGLKGNRYEPKPLDNFYVLRNTKCPSILVEHGFMDSRTDTPIILTEKYARQVANAHLEFYEKTFSLKKKDSHTNRPIEDSKGLELKFGVDNKEVTQLQTDLNVLGYGTQIKGKFGREVTRDVKQWQIDHNLEPTGIVDENLLNRINILANQQRHTDKLKRKE